MVTAVIPRIVRSLQSDGAGVFGLLARGGEVRDHLRGHPLRVFDAGVDRYAAIRVSGQEEPGARGERALDSFEARRVADRVLRNAAAVPYQMDELRPQPQPHRQLQIAPDDANERRVVELDRERIARAADRDAQESLPGGRAPLVDAGFPERAEDARSLTARHQEAEAIQRSAFRGKGCGVVPQAGDRERRRFDRAETA